MTQYVILDDDPTGAQAVAGARVLLRWSPQSVRRALEETGRPVHIVTNTRALSPDDARRTTADAAEAALVAANGVQLVLRGDSTLRAHVLEEYLGIVDATAPGRSPVLLLVPALPAFGRVTIDGTHYVVRDGMHTPLHLTEYARDALLGYKTARLLDWAAERSGGYFAAAAGREVRLDSLRREGGRAVALALAAAPTHRPTVVACDAETLQDLEAVADGFERAVAAGVPVIVRCAPVFVGLLGKHLASAGVEPPAATGPVLVVCGSYVPTSTRQLAELVKRHPDTLVEVPIEALASEAPAEEIARAVAETAALLARAPVVALSTPRTAPAAGTAFQTSLRVAANLARIVAELPHPPATVVAKGGVTSVLIAQIGLEADEADVVGPILPGVSLWNVRSRSGRRPLIVFPGNIGADTALADLVDILISGRLEAKCSSG